MADSETRASEAQNSRALQAEVLRLRDALEGAEAEARTARARAQAASVELDGLPLAHENLRLRDELAHARVTAHYFESLYLRVSAERERDHEKLVSEFTGSRTWRIGAAVMSPLAVAKRVRGKRS